MREPDVKQGSHSDTSFSSGSLRAARRAAGAVKHAVDWYVNSRMQKNENEVKFLLTTQLSQRSSWT